MAKMKCVSLRKLLQIASGTALENGLIAPSHEDIARMYYLSEKKLLPIVKYCEAGTVWVDRYYVAYQIGAGNVHYTYISKHHLAEEICAYRAAAAERKLPISIPADIQRCFQVAQDEMELTGLPYWIAAPWAEKIPKKARVNITEHLEVL